MILNDVKAAAFLGEFMSWRGNCDGSEEHIEDDINNEITTDTDCESDQRPDEAVFSGGFIVDDVGDRDLIPGDDNIDEEECSDESDDDLDNIADKTGNAGGGKSTGIKIAADHSLDNDLRVGDRWTDVIEDGREHRMILYQEYGGIAAFIYCMYVLNVALY